MMPTVKCTRFKEVMVNMSRYVVQFCQMLPHHALNWQEMGKDTWSIQSKRSVVFAVMQLMGVDFWRKIGLFQLSI